MDFNLLRYLGEQLVFLHNQDFTQKLEIFVIAWFFIRRTIAGHFEKIELGLSNVADEVKKLGGTLDQLETDHSIRLMNLETRVNKLSLTAIQNK